jgi:hypothetical protein
MHLMIAMIFEIVRGAQPLHRGFEDTRAYRVSQQCDCSDEQQDFPRFFTIKIDCQQGQNQEKDHPELSAGDHPHHIIPKWRIVAVNELEQVFVPIECGRVEKFGHL